MRTEKPSDMAGFADGDDDGSFDDKEHFTSGGGYGGYELTNVDWHTDPALGPATFPHDQEEDDATNTDDVGF